MKDRALIIFVKAPVPGKVKTRLARELGDWTACRIYSEMGKAVAERLGRGDLWDTVFAFTPPDGEARVRDWLGPGFSYRPQRGDDLGERMFRAISDALESGYGRAVLAGSDIPDLSVDIVRRAFALLDEADVVLGPAQDGGYYLIGMKRPHREPFRDIDWSTPGVFGATVENIRAAGLSFSAVETLSDVDSAEDLKSVFNKTGKGNN